MQHHHHIIFWLFIYFWLYWVFPAARALHWQIDSYPLYHQGSPSFFHFIQCLIGSSMQCSINASFLLMHEKHSIDFVYFVILLFVILFKKMLHFVYPFVTSWLFGLFPLWGCYEKMLLYIFEYRFLWDVLRNCLLFLPQTSKIVLNRSSKSRHPHLV